MSRDIRSFFQPHKAQNSKLEDDDEVIPESPNVEIKVKKREVRKKRVLSDSDEEIFSSKKKKHGDEGKHLRDKLPTDKSAKKHLKEVKVLDVFGTAPVKRSESNIQKVKKKTETDIHSDEDFDQSLLDLDDNDKEISKHKSDVENKTKVNIGFQDEINNGKDESIITCRSTKQESDMPLKKVDKKLLENVNTDKSGQIISKRTKQLKETPNQLEEYDTATNESCQSKNQSHNFNDSAANKHDTNVSKKKKNLETTLNESVTADEERFERKRHSAALYQKYLNRSGPKHLGTKEMPQGAPNCLKDCAFLLTGVLDSFEREEVAEAITKFGGTVKNSMSKKVTHVLAGDEAGPAKIAKAQEFGVTILNEDDFMELIVTKSKEMKSEQLVIKDKKSNRRSVSEKSIQDKKMKISSERMDSPKVSNHATDNHVSPEKTSISEDKRGNTEHVKSENIPKPSVSTTENLNGCNSGSSKNINTDVPQSSMWVDKYKPQTLKQIIGQHGEASNVKKLCNWLTKWYVNRKAKLPKPSPWAKNDDGGYYKAALLSGPPGVGKTTTVSLVCKELGFDIVEFNASDTRNKSLIKEQIGELLTTTSLSGYAKGANGKQAVTKKRVLVMDEVDGMAGNEDRGGLQELIGLIKSASVPIICTCNDRNSQKMRSLVNYCYDLRFNRPRVDQIKAAMLSVCCKEGLRVPGEVLVQLIGAARQDVRQTLHLLAVHAAAPAAPAGQCTSAQPYTKDIKLGPWEAIRKVFSAEEHKTMSIHDKSDLFFYDYSLAPLFVQENYLQVAPHCPKHLVAERVSRAADAISAGDLVDARVRSRQAWSLLPVQAMYSSVIPGHAMAGHITGQIQFPGWLGKNSRRTKMHRLGQEIHAHTRLITSGSKSSIFLDYCTHLRDAVVAPLARDKAEGVARALAVLEAYHLLREDLDSLGELALWPGQPNPMTLIDSKVKSAMTRSYNKRAAALPYAPAAARRARPGAAAGADDDDDELSHDEPEDSDPENDALIKKKKVKENEKSSSGKDIPGPSKDKPSSSKGRSKKK